MARYLITSGCGFIGARLAQALMQSGHYVLILDTWENIKRRDFADSDQCEVGDMLDSQLIEQYMGRVDACFLLDPSKNKERGFELTSELNILRGVTAEVFKAAQFYRVPIIYSSSDEVYGDAGGGPLKETSAVLPQTPYAAHFCALENKAKQLSIEYGVPTLGLRLFSVYGPRRSNEGEGNDVISRFIRSAEKNQALTIDGDGNQNRDFIHIDDVVQHFVAALNNLRSHPRVFNVCSGRPVTIKHLASLICRFSGKVLPMCYQESEKPIRRMIVGDTELVRANLSAGHTTSLCAGLISMISNKMHDSIPSRRVTSIQWKSA